MASTSPTCSTRMSVAPFANAARAAAIGKVGSSRSSAGAGGAVCSASVMVGTKGNRDVDHITRSGVHEHLTDPEQVPDALRRRLVLGLDVGDRGGLLVEG